MDKLTLFFINNSITVKDYYWNNTSLWLGKRICRGNMEIVYSIKEDVITLIIYRRMNNRQLNLANPFRAFLWFVETVIAQTPEIKYITGKVDALNLDNSYNLTSKRLIDFYCRIMGGQLDANSQCGTLWFELAKYKNMRQRKKQCLIKAKGTSFQSSCFPKNRVTKTANLYISQGKQNG